MIKHTILVALIFIAGCIPDPIFAGNFSLSWIETQSGIKEKVISSALSDSAGAFDFNANYKYGTSGGTVTKDQGSLSLGYDPKINDKWSIWLDYTAGYNKPWGIEFENMLGGGPKYYIIKNDDRKMSFSTGILYQYDANTQEGQRRLSHRLKYKDRRTALTYFHQPDIDNSADYISKGTATFKLTKLFSAFYSDSYRSIGELKETEQGVRLEIEY